MAGTAITLEQALCELVITILSGKLRLAAEPYRPQATGTIANVMTAICQARRETSGGYAAIFIKNQELISRVCVSARET